MTDTAQDLRTDPPKTDDHEAQLLGFLDYLRATVPVKATGLAEADAHRSVLPSELMTVAGLVSHLRWVEAFWFRVVLSGEPDRAPYTDEDPDAEFKVDHRPLAELLAEYAQECAHSNEVLAALGYQHEVPFRGGTVNAHWVVTHMVEETGRHVGHLDVLRELLDGVTGE